MNLPSLSLITVCIPMHGIGLEAGAKKSFIVARCYFLLLR